VSGGIKQFFWFFCVCLGVGKTKCAICAMGYFAMLGSKLIDIRPFSSELCHYIYQPIIESKIAQRMLFDSKKIRVKKELMKNPLIKR
jgi:hypothetical protein